MSVDIRCPYCFKWTKDDEVCFRAETFFREEDEVLDFIKKQGLGDFEELHEVVSAGGEVAKQAELCKMFMAGSSPEYDKFWNIYSGQTTECKEIGAKIEPWLRPVKSCKDQKAFPQIIRDSDGFVKEAVDVFGRTTQRRVCPHCHNPFPANYGKYSIKYISVIGIKGAGKTVYISQLLKEIHSYFASFGYVLETDRIVVQSYLAENRVETGCELPRGTGTDVFVQPMAFTMLYKDSADRLNRQTFVLYDIAGELFDKSATAAALLNRFDFIKNSDGIIMLIDPKQVGLTNDGGEDVANITSALDVINGLFNDGGKEQIRVPLAMCISKGDMAYRIALGKDGGVADSLPSTQIKKKQFNAEDYNQVIQAPLDHYFQKFETLNLTLETLYKHFNYFIFSSLGHGGIDNDNKLTDVTTTLRIEEPLFWMLHKLGFVGTNVPVNPPSCTIKPEEKPKSFWERIKEIFKKH